MTSHPAPAVADSDVRAQLTALVYELLDAHHDTVELGSGGGGCRASLRWPASLRWRAHLDYLRALQRNGREILAAIDATQAGHGCS